MKEMKLTAGILSLTLYLVISVCSEARGWVRLTEGLEYRGGLFSAGKEGEAFEYDAVRVDLRVLEIRVIDARDCCHGPATVLQMARKTNALAVINGGFFDEHQKPLGLVIANYKQRNPLRRVTWWGVFFLEQATPKIALTKRYKPKEDVGQALQCGPRLLVAGHVPKKLKPQVVRRSAVALDGSGRVVLLCTRSSRVSAGLLGRFLGLDESKGGLGCRDALNLDGGPSSQLFLEAGPREVHIEGGSPVLNGIGVFGGEEQQER